MIPVLTPAEMAEVDANAPETLDVLVERAATKVAASVIDLLGGTYGRRVLVVAGPGNNGLDGKVAARILRRRGVRVEVLDARSDDLSSQVAAALGLGTDLVVDAAFGTGFRGEFHFPDVGDVDVLAVDIPSGVNGLTGSVSGRAAQAVATVTFAALKPGALFGDGAVLSGQVRLADIGLDTSGATMHLVEDSDIGRWLPRRDHGSHKWKSATWLFAGSPGMMGAARLSCAAAQRAGSGYVRHTPVTVERRTGEVGAETGGAVGSAGAGADAALTYASEAVVDIVAPSRWHSAVESDVARFGSVAVGPGIGRDPATVEAVRRLAALDGFTLLIDGDGLNALGTDAAQILSARRSPTVLTPHDREFERISGTTPGDDRIAAAVEFAAWSNSVVLLKGPTTVVADPAGGVLLSNSGDPRLATAGTGDVLTGVIAAHLAMGVEPLRAAAAGAFVHGRAATIGPRYGVVASDLVAALPAVYTDLLS